MEISSPSRTARLISTVVAFGASDPRFRPLLDQSTQQLSLRLLRESLSGRFLSIVLRCSLFRKCILTFANLLTPGFIVHVLCRKATIRNLVSRSVTTDTQIIILGAGYDLLGYTQAQSHSVIEIDHPATSMSKQRLISIVDAPKLLTFIAADLSQRALDEVLSKFQTFHKSSRKIWIIEGVFMYLTHSNIDALLSQIRKLSSNGSEIIFTFMETQESGSFDFRNQNHLVKRWLKNRSEPFLSGFRVSELSGVLESHGFQLIKVYGRDELRQLLSQDLRNSTSIAEGELIAHARIY